MGIGLPKKLLATPAGSPGEDLDGALHALLSCVNKHDSYTAGHSTRVAGFAAGLARLMGLAPGGVELVRQAGIVHDIGKIAIPDRILTKRGRLSEDEFQLIKLHPIMGASILSRIPSMKALVPTVLHHHERWDGAGYPSGTTGVDIPLEARIIFAADAFDAMTSVRTYGKTYKPEEALAEMRRHSGKQFDPLAIDALHEAYRYGLLDDYLQAVPHPA